MLIILTPLRVNNHFTFIGIGGGYSCFAGSSTDIKNELNAKRGHGVGQMVDAVAHFSLVPPAEFPTSIPIEYPMAISQWWCQDHCENMGAGAYNWEVSYISDFRPGTGSPPIGSIARRYGCRCYSLKSAEHIKLQHTDPTLPTDKPVFGIGWLFCTKRGKYH